MSRETLLAAVLRAAHERGWPLARLDAPADPGAPFDGRDADLLAAWRPWSDWRALTRTVADGLGWRIVNIAPTGGVLSLWLAGPAAETGDPPETAQLDFHRALSAGGIPFVDPRTLFAAAAAEAGALRLKPEDARGARALEKWLVHGGAAPTGVPAALLAAALENGGAADRLPPRLRAGIAALRQRPGLALRLLAAKLADAARRLVRPPGVLLVVSGPDGAGKSLMIAGLTAAIPRRLAPNARLFHTRPFLLPRFGVSPPAPPAAETLAPPTRPDPVRSWLRWLIACADYRLGGLFWVRPALMAGRVVIFDRYVLDYQAVPWRRGIAVPAWALALMARMAPRPDAVIVLTAAPAELVRRKGEATPEEAARQNQTYARLAADIPGALTLDTGALDPATVARRARAHLIDVMAARHAHPDYP